MATIVTVGSARSASRGSSKPGDQGQTSNTNDRAGEVSMQDMYSDSRGWYVFRPLSASYATTMAQMMITACNNANIGYSQPRRQGVWTYGVNSTTATDADCSSLVSYIVKEVTGKNLGAFTTSTEQSVLKNSGLFVSKFTYVSQSSTPLYNGDILVTKSSGHTMMAVKGNPRGGQDDTSLDGTIYGAAYDVASGIYVAIDDIDASYISQYIITVDRNTPNPDFATMLKHRVSGVVIEAGYLYTSSHMETYPRNPYLKSQCFAASDAKMPFGLYWDCKARSVSEAKDELYQLSFMIREYPPTLGMWIHPVLAKSTSTNNSIITTYQEKLIDLGLKDRIGFYCTKSELSKITWKNFQEDWYLWIVDHVSDVSEVNQLLQPEFFSVS